MAVGSSNEEDWEYEYSATEAETFFVDLDLSSVNGLIKSKNAGDRKSLKRPNNGGQPPIIDKMTGHSAAQTVGEGVNENDNEDDHNDEAMEGWRADREVPDANTASQPQSPKEPGLLDDDDAADRIQILDLHTTNPIISYDGHVYSCTWHDMLGTSIFISKHQEAPFHEPEISTEDYDLISTSRLKLVGSRAKIAPKAGPKKRRRDESEVDANDLEQTAGLQQRVPDGRSLGTITRTNPKTNIEIKQQASFLEKLMEIKQSRGEHDTVRTFVDRRTQAADARQARKAKRTDKAKEKQKEETKEQRLRREIHELNKRVVKGDNDALERLQEIYADMEEIEDDEDELLIGNIDANASNSSHPTSDNNRTRTGNASNSRVPVLESVSTGLPHVADSAPNGASGYAPLH